MLGINSKCETCPAHSQGSFIQKLGLKLDNWKYVVALAGNPNTGKSTVFNNLTGLRQHTGNWPGKTISRAEGGFSYNDQPYKIVDLPGTYSLLSASQDEEIARDFLLFGKPDVTVIVMDATALERNLNLALQVLQITGRAVLAINLMDEARAEGIAIDIEGLEKDLGIPVVPMVARQGEGIDRLLAVIEEIATGERPTTPPQLNIKRAETRRLLDRMTGRLRETFPELSQHQWIALRILEGDHRIREAFQAGTLGHIQADPNGSGGVDLDAEDTPPAMKLSPEDAAEAEDVLSFGERLSWKLPPDFHDRLVEDIYGEASRIAGANMKRSGPGRRAWQARLDRILTGPFTGIPVMGLILATVLWLTIAGANVPSGMLASFLIDYLHPIFKGWSAAIGLPFWLDGLLIDGIYLTTAWVISVMLPPMAIFFPLFTLLEDFGYLPRVAFNLDRMFQRCGAHGKQALTMSMGFGCNAAGVIAARVIDSPREKLIAIITNNFALCNGRWPTMILMATIFVAPLAPRGLGSFVAAAAVFGVATLGILLTFGVSWVLSRTLLQGESSAFSLELPPYRPPRFWRTLYTSIIDRTLFVLWRAIVFALPAGAAIWLLCNFPSSDHSAALWLIEFLEPIGWPFGLTGIILLAYVVAIPANEIVVPTILMLTVMATSVHIDGAAGAGVLFETDEVGPLISLLTAGGWTLMTAVCLMMFSLCHNPCSTTIYTIYKETGSLKWTAWSTAIPLFLGFSICGVIATVWRLIA